MEVYCSGSKRNYKALHSARWGTSTAGPVVSPGYVKLVIKSLCQAPLLSCWDVLIKKKWEDRDWHSYCWSDFFFFSLKTREIKSRSSGICVHEYPLDGI